MSDPKDGFDLIDYPCEFAFKAMVRVAGLAGERTAEQAILDLISKQADGLSVLEISSAASRTGRFESVTLRVLLQNREQLEFVYALLADDPNVVMTL